MKAHAVIIVKLKRTRNIEGRREELFPFLKDQNPKRISFSIIISEEKGHIFHIDRKSSFTFQAINLETYDNSTFKRE